jgi:tetratricopeptide (TPR) repeat protein
MGIFLRLLFLAAFAWVGFVLFSLASSEAHLENPDTSRVIVLFGGTIIDGAVIAVLLTTLIIPAVGTKIGSFFYNPDQKIEHDPHADAIARVLQGDFEGAIEDYEEIFRKDPADTLALSEIARICCRDLGDTARAATVIERALEDEWTHEQGSFLANRLADIYLLQNDPMRARQVLVEIAQNLDGTKYAANALHRLHEVDRAIETGGKTPVYVEDSRDEVETADDADGEPEPPTAS